MSDTSSQASDDDSSTHSDRASKPRHAPPWLVNGTPMVAEDAKVTFHGIEDSDEDEINPRSNFFQVLPSTPSSFPCALLHSSTQAFLTLSSVGKRSRAPGKVEAVRNGSRKPVGFRCEAQEAEPCSGRERQIQTPVVSTALGRRPLGPSLNPRNPSLHEPHAAANCCRSHPGGPGAEHGRGHGGGPCSSPSSWRSFWLLLHQLRFLLVACGGGRLPGSEAVLKWTAERGFLRRRNWRDGPGLKALGLGEWDESIPRDQLASS